MKIDFAKRRKVMERSKLLGHCICDTRRPCPCDVLREQNICPCAGERPDPVDISQIKLTQLVKNAGCASKIAPSDLDAVLKRLPAVTDPAVISGLAAADDAAIYRLSENLCLVQTVDVFTPCVDDPRLFGQICAANCLSDIYAMGGEPKTALSVLAFPSEKLPGEIIFQMLDGAMGVFQSAGVALVGGHSVKDDEIKLGFAITGTIDPNVSSALEKPSINDILVLTKPLGTGVLSFCRQIGRDYPKGFAEAEVSMATLNRAAAEAMKEAKASACTDITGFGLFAHLMRMLRGSQLSAEIFASSLPAFDGSLDALSSGVIPGAIERNREYVGGIVDAAPGVDEAFVNLGLDAQTSGGLLIAVSPDRFKALHASLSKRSTPCFVIGKITSGPSTRICLSKTSERVSEANKPSMQEKTTMTTPHQDGCCAEFFQNPSATGTAAESQRAFGALMRSVQAAGALSEKTKELILFSQVISSRCEPCFEAHYQKALEMGITQQELDEAAWCAIAMGGAPVKMFYQKCLSLVQGQPKTK